MLAAVAFHDFVAAVDELDRRWAEAGVTDDEQSVLDGYRWAMSLIGVANDVFIWADAKRPRFVDIVGPYRKFNGDNVDASYQFAPIDPTRTYRIRGQRGDAVYFSLSVYGTALDKTDRVVHTDHIVGTINDRDVSFDAAGAFHVVLAPARPEGWTGAFLALTVESVCVITRDYRDESSSQRRVAWHIDADEPPFAFRDTDAALAERFAAASRWIRAHALSMPIQLGPPNIVSPPYPVPKVTVGWAAGDAAYAMGSFALGDNQALVIRGRSPECRFWNLCLWTPFTTTYNYDYEEPVSINGRKVVYEEDGSWEIVVAPRDPGHPNWVSTAGHRKGRLWFRWFYPVSTPEQPSCEVIEL